MGKRSKAKTPTPAKVKESAVKRALKINAKPLPEKQSKNEPKIAVSEASLEATTTDLVLNADAWNNFDLKRPPLLTLATNDMRLVALLQNVIQPAMRKWFTHNDRRDKKFTNTAALLCRLIARRKNSFRRMAGFQTLCKINAALRRLLRVDLRRELERFDGALPDGVYAGVEVPTANCCEFVIARLLAVYHIHKRVYDLCVVAAEYFVRLMHSNYFMEINVLLLAVLAKLHSFSGVMGNECVELYAVLRTHWERLPNTANNRVLPDNFVFPAQLDKFNVEQIKPHQPKPKEAEEATMSSLVTISQPLIVNRKPKHLKQQDVGVAIERAPSTSAAKSEFSLEQLQTVDHICTFFKSETKERERAPTTCVTKNVQQHEWLGLQKLFQRKLEANDHKKALSIVRKFLSNKL